MRADQCLLVVVVIAKLCNYLARDGAMHLLFGRCGIHVISYRVGSSVALPYPCLVFSYLGLWFCNSRVSYYFKITHECDTTTASHAVLIAKRLNEAKGKYAYHSQTERSLSE